MKSVLKKWLTFRRDQNREPNQLAAFSAEVSILLDQYLESEKGILELVMGRLKFNLVSSDEMVVRQEVFEKFSIEIAKKYRVFPVGFENGFLLVASSEPWDIYLLQRLEFLTNCQIKFEFALENEIAECLVIAESKIDQLTGVTADFLLLDDSLSSDKNDELDESDAAGPIVKFINTTIKTALKKRASDIHIESYEHWVKVKYRIDGQLYPATEALDAKHHNAFVSRLKVMAELDIAEKRIPQDGRFKLNTGNREIDFRISVLPSIHGENVVIRILDTKGASRELNGLSLHSLGITESQLKAFVRIVNEPYGMVLITGPTGSGKTTTLYSALRETSTGGEKIITIEDPVEYQLDGITQIPVNNKKGLTFAKGLRSILRHDPDKILVGEIRDPETADIAVQSALTGHLVLSSVHANNAIDVMARLHNMGVNLSNALSALNAVMAQRLIRVLCPSCKRETLDIPAEVAQCAEQSSIVTKHIYRAVGCTECDGTGYAGRTVISELLMISESVRSAAISGDKVDVLISSSEFVNGETLRSVAIRKCCLGITSYEEVNRVTFA